MTIKLDEAKVRKRTEEAGWTQAQLAKNAGVSLRTLNRVHAGKRIKSRNATQVAEALGTTLEELSCGPADSVVAPSDADKEPARVRRRPTMRFDHLPQLLNLTSFNIVVADRRAVPAQSPSDILRPLSWIDTALLPHIIGALRHDIVSDAQVAAADIRNQGSADRWERPWLSIAGPDANYASLLMNAHALFRFVVDESATTRVFTKFAELRDLPPQEQRERLFRFHEEQQALLDSLCPTAYFDPLASTPRQALHGRSFWGIVSLAGHPWIEGVPCISAGGVRGSGTAGAMALLAGRTIWDPTRGCHEGLSTRPLGGVIAIRDAQRPPPEDVLHIEQRCEWITPPYTVEEASSRLSRLSAEDLRKACMSKHDVQRMLSLIENSRPTPAELSSRTMRVEVVIPTGGKGTRMRELTGDSKSKLDLMIGSRTVLEWTLHALDKLEAVDAAVLVTTPTFLDQQSQTAKSYSTDDFTVSTRDETTAGFHAAMLEEIAEILGRGAWCLVLMPDTLIAPRELECFIDATQQGGADGAVATVQVPLKRAREYGSVILLEGRVVRILEKPGQPTETRASAGTFLLSPELHGRVVDFARQAKGDVVTLFCALCDHAVLRAHALEEPFFDVGSVLGYEDAQQRLAELKAAWEVGE